MAISVDTAKRVRMLFGHDLTGTLLIDPVWFIRYRIQKVPAVLVRASLDELNWMQDDDNTSFADPSDYDVVYGDAGLIYALQSVAHSGTQKIVAKIYLQCLQKKLEAQHV